MLVLMMGEEERLLTVLSELVFVVMDRLALLDQLVTRG